MRTSNNPANEAKATDPDQSRTDAREERGNQKRKTKETKAEKRLRRGAISVERWLVLMA